MITWKKVLGYTKVYIWNILIWLDQGLNTLTFGNPDETLSSRWGKGTRRDCKFCTLMCKILDLFDKGHCERYIEEDETENLYKGVD